jgi:hypothetical protein
MVAIVALRQCEYLEWQTEDRLPEEQLQIFQFLVQIVGYVVCCCQILAVVAAAAVHQPVKLALQCLVGG